MTDEAVPPDVDPVAPATAADPPRDKRPCLAEMFGLAKQLDGTWPLFARSLNPATDPAHLRGRFRAAAASTARWSARRSYFEGNLTLLAVLLVLAAAFTVLVAVFSINSWQEFILAVVGTAVFLTIAGWVEMRRHHPLFRFIDTLFGVVGLGLFPATLYIRYASGPAWAVDLADRWWMPILQGIGTACAALVLMWILINAAMWLWDRESHISLTEPLFEQLTAILSRTELDRRGHLPPKARQEIHTLLAKVAFLLRAGIPTVARSGTPLTRAVVRTRAIEASQAVIDLQLWIALPSMTTYDDFRRRIADLTCIILTGEYDRLPIRKTTPEATRRTWHVRIMDAARTLIIALVPLAGLLITDRLGFTLPSPLDGAALIAALAWAIVLFLSLLDPLFPAHLAAVRDLITLVPFTRATGNNPGNRPSL
ncbi:hypothetical protein ACQP2T_60290 [Nonomuraea sp. CA-143628]|uniref:hypothetical protein n=1 Tax=Nonomuraea sp. CA-143628 TaxID=3239997 RepID=UPI003D8B073D